MRQQYYSIDLTSFLYKNQMFQTQNYAIYIGKKSLTLQTLSTHQYAQAVQLYNILLQATKIFLRKNTLTPQQTIPQYLSQCNKGENVLLKSYNSFHKSTMNRMCFLYNFIKIFQLQNHQRNGLDYFQLFRLLCSDFPKQVVLKSVNNINQTKDDMAKIVSSKKFVNALYLNFIYSDYSQSLLRQIFKESSSASAPIPLLLQWIIKKQQNLYKVYQKPTFSPLVQALLNQMRRKNLIPSQDKKITFLTDKNLKIYVQDCCVKQRNLQNQGSNSHEYYSSAYVTYDEFTRQLLNQSQFIAQVKQHLDMFQNSILWGVQTYKILSIKQVVQTPINQKKMKKK